MTTYDEGPITLINVFEVEPEKLDAFIASWRERAELMSRQPGFRSLRLHRACLREPSPRTGPSSSG